MLGLFAFSLLISVRASVIGRNFSVFYMFCKTNPFFNPNCFLFQLITKFAGASFLSDIFDERSFNQDSVAMYTELALNGIEKAKSLYEDVLNKE